MGHFPLAHAVMGDIEGCREQESPEEVERVLERQRRQMSLPWHRGTELGQSKERPEQPRVEGKGDTVSPGEGTTHMPAVCCGTQESLPALPLAL